MRPTRRRVGAGAAFKTRKQKRVPAQPEIPPPRATLLPGADFYRFVNANWMRRVNMPPQLASQGVSEEIEDQIDKECMQILRDARSEVRVIPDEEISHTKNLLGVLTESALNTPAQENNIRFLRTLLGNLRCMRSVDDVGNIIGEYNRYQISTLLLMFVATSESSSKMQHLCITTGNISLPDTSQYFQQTIEQVRTIQAQSKILKRLGEQFDVPNLDQFVGIERIAADALTKSTNDDEVMMSGADLKREQPAVPWLAILSTATGWPESKISSNRFLILSTHWLKFLNKCFRSFTLDQWRLWLAGNVIMHVFPLLPPPFDDMHFELFGHRMRGQAEKIPQHRLALRMAQQWLTGTLGYAFVKKHVSPTIKTKASTVAEEIRSVAADRILHTEWLEPKTRKIASEKIKKIYLGIAFPKEIPKDRSMQLDSDNLVKNILRLAEGDFEASVEKVHKELKPEEWDDPVFAVNAQYQNEGNRLILPAGILRWPFQHPNATDGWNFGGIGATIGHEITHAFDVDGKNQDQFGNRKTWWSPAELRRYNQKTRRIIELFDKTTQFGHTLNGVLTLSENIADLDGLAIALEALKRRLKRRGVSAAEQKHEICDFFLSFATSWRTKEKKQKALQSLFVDVHAPPPARVNNVVSQFDEWQECFDVRPGDALQKDPKDRIRIF